MQPLIFLLNAPLLLAHELCHYVTARCLGIPARLGLAQTKVWPTGVDWRLYLVLLAPAFAAPILLCVALLLALWRGVDLLPVLLLGAAGSLLWQLSCLRDFYSVWYLRRYGCWPNDDEGPQFEWGPLRGFEHNDG